MMIWAGRPAALTANDSPLDVVVIVGSFIAMPVAAFPAAVVALDGILVLATLTTIWCDFPRFLPVVVFIVARVGSTSNVAGLLRLADH
jgi:hypothetical protein